MTAAAAGRARRPSWHPLSFRAGDPARAPTTCNTMIASPARFSAAAALVAAFSCPLAAQTTVSIVADRDNTLYEDLAGGLSNGSGPSVFVGINGINMKLRTLLHFDVAGSVPAGARVIAADLQLYVEQSAAFLPLAVGAHRIGRSWGEGASVAGGPGLGNGGGGTAAAPGDATWLHAFFPNTFWNTAGGDFAPTASFSIELPNLFGFQSAPLPGLVADVQDWLDNPAQNHGWLLKSDELVGPTARRLDSREAAANRPTLHVTYLLPGDTGAWGVGCPVGTSTFALALGGSATGGNTVSITYSSAPPLSIGANFFSLALDPIGVPLFPSCTLYLPVTQEIIGGEAFLTDAGGNGATSLLVPAGFPGFLINCQAAAFDATPLGISLSNSGVMLTQ